MGEIADRIHDEQLHEKFRKGGKKANRNRSRSGANKRCPQCGKALRGDKGLKAHLKAEHGVEVGK